MELTQQQQQFIEKFKKLQSIKELNGDFITLGKTIEQEWNSFSQEEKEKIEQYAKEHHI